MHISSHLTALGCELDLEEDWSCLASREIPVLDLSFGTSLPYWIFPMCLDPPKIHVHLEGGLSPPPVRKRSARPKCLRTETRTSNINLFFLSSSFSLQTPANSFAADLVYFFFGIARSSNSSGITILRSEIMDNMKVCTQMQFLKHGLQVQYHCACKAHGSARGLQL